MDNKRNNPNYTSDRIMMAVILGIIIRCLIEFEILRRILFVSWVVEVILFVLIVIAYMINNHW